MWIEISDDDRAIIALLKENGRMSASEVARRVGGVTDRTVRNRIDRLVRRGVIVVGAVTRSSALGLSVNCDVIVEVTPWKLDETVHALAACDEVWYLAASPKTGQVSMKLLTGSEVDARAFVRDVVAKQAGVMRITTVVTPIVVKGPLGFEVGTREEP